MLLKPLLEHAARAPEALAVIDDRGTTTYGRLAASAVGLGAMLRRATDRPTVGVLLPTSAAFATAFYGTLAAGKVAVPVNFLLGEREVGHVLRDSGVDVVLSAPPLADKLAGVPGIRVVDLSALPAGDAAKPQAAEPHVAGSDDVAVLLYTSGTAGPPKGVELTHGNLAGCVEAAIEHYQLTGRHTFLGVIPLFHSTGLTATLLLPVRLGATAVYAARFSPAGTIALVREHGVTVMAAVPSMYGVMARLKQAGPDDAKTLYAPLSGGEPLPAEVREGFARKFGVPLMEGYGLTETCGPIAVNTPSSHRPGSVGRLLPGARAKLIDDAGTDVSAGPSAEGEVCFAGPTIMGRYHGLPDATRDAFTPDGYFRTGDLGRLDADGYLFITGRKKDLVIVGGEKVHPREVEELLVRHPAIADAAVVGRPDASRGEAVVAFVVAADGESVDANALREFCRSEGLVNWKLPRDVHVVDALPRSPTGKVLKRELVARLAAAD